MERYKMYYSIQKLDKALDRFQSMARLIDKLHTVSSRSEQHDLAIHTRKALNGLDGMIDWVKFNRDAMWEQLNPVDVPVTRPDKPKLTLIKGGKANG